MGACHHAPIFCYYACLCKWILGQLFDHRDAVIKVVRQKVDLDTITLTKINHYYLQRNKLVHERATVDPTEADVENYSETIQKVLTKLFGITTVRLSFR